MVANQTKKRPDMIKNIVLLCVLLVSFLGISQEHKTVEFINAIKLDADTFIGVNMFNEQFYIKDNTLFKKTSKNVYSYKNIELGDIHTVGIINSFQSSVFYKDFNMFVQLDKKLGELYTIDFNTLSNFSTVTYAAITSNKRLWIFNSDTQQLQIYNPQHNNIEVSTIPLQEPVLKFYSNYNFCWVLSKTKLLQFNIYGNLLNSYALKSYDDFVYYKGLFILQKANELFLLSSEETVPKKIILPEIPIKDFSVTNETLYIYTGKELYSFTINLKQTE
jgi:hypothetical protein